MAKYKKRKDGRYLAQVQIGFKDDGKPKYKSIYGRTIAELDNKVSEFKALLSKGILLESKGITLKEWTETWLKTYKTEVSPGTYKRYETIVNKHIPEIGDIKLKDLKPFHIQELINAKISENEKQTPRLIYVVLKQALDQAIKNDLIYKNPLTGIKKPSAKSPEKRALTDDELTLINAADFTPKERLFVYFGLYAGLRRGEILALTKTDVKNNEININKTVILKNHNDFEIKPTPKTEAGIRKIPLLEPLKSILEDYLETHKEIYLFKSSNQPLMTKTAYQNLWHQIRTKMMGADKMKAPVDITAHTLRHTFATNLYYAGVDIKTAQYLLGHSSPNITLQIYTHLDKLKSVKNENIGEKLQNYFNSNQSKISQTQ